MPVVVDASLALKWVLEEEDSDLARVLRDGWVRSDEPVIAPPIFRPEIANALHRAVRRGGAMRAVAVDGLEVLVSEILIDEPPGLYTRALEIAGELALGATYDALYMALAEHHACDMWTADRRLVRTAQQQFPSVRWLGEMPAA